MITPYIAQPPVDDFGQRSASLKLSGNFSSGSNHSFTVPGSANVYKALIKCQTDPTSICRVWMAINETAEVASVGAFSFTTSELLTSSYYVCREVRSGDVLDFHIEASNTSINVSLYALGTNN